MAKKVETTKKPVAKKPETENTKAVVTVETIDVKPFIKEEYKPMPRVSGKHRVKFLPNGSNPKLGMELKFPSADVAQDFVDRGWGKVVE